MERKGSEILRRGSVALRPNPALSASVSAVRFPFFSSFPRPLSPSRLLPVLRTPGSLILVLDGAGQPVKTLIQALGGGRAGALNVPVALAERVKRQLVRDLRRVHRVREILLVGKHKQDGVAQLILVEHAVQLVPGLRDTVAVIAVHNENQALGVLEVVAPKRANLVLSSHIPHREADVLVLDRLDVETDGGNGGHDLAKLELVEDGRLPSRVKTHHQDAHLLLGEQAREQLRDCEPHGAGV
mmetsp:Transcript_2779/g.10083  ORF Transcript_2779/g.10083 Transcript_2779/m.10083 type:complete len:242 (+) Transcript_2779:67-792(+)